MEIGIRKKIFCVLAVSILLLLILSCASGGLKNVFSGAGVNPSAAASIYFQSADCHPKPFCGEIRFFGAKKSFDVNERNFPKFVMKNAQFAQKDFERIYRFDIWAGEEPVMVRKSMYPDGRLAAIAFSEHPDGSSADSISAVYFGTSDEKSPEYMKSGFVGNQIKTTRSDWALHSFENDGISMYIIDPKTGDITAFGMFAVADANADKNITLSEVKRFEKFVDDIPNDYYAAAVYSGPMLFEYRKEIFLAMQKIGAKKMTQMHVFDNYCILGKKGLKSGEAEEVLIAGRNEEDTGKSRTAEINKKLDNPPILIIIRSSNKYDDADCSIDVYRNNQLLLPPEQSAQTRNSGLMTCPARRKVIQKLYDASIEICPHTIRNSNDREVINLGIDFFKKNFKSKVWIDHGFNYEDLVRYGADKRSQYYIIDKLGSAGYRYAWNWWDCGYYCDDSAVIDQSLYPFNLMYPDKNASLPVLFYKNNQADDAISDGQITFFNASPIVNINAKSNAYAPAVIDDLIVRRGIHISHSYFTNELGNFLVKQDNAMTIKPEFEHALKYICKRINQGIIWNPTISEMGDYFKALEKIELQYLSANRIIVRNNNSFNVKNLTLIARGVSPSMLIFNGEKFSGRTRVEKSDFFFWFDIEANAEHLIEIRDANTVKKSGGLSIDKFLNKKEIHNPYYDVIVDDTGLIKVLSKKGERLFNVDSFSARYDIAEISIKKIKPVIDVKDEKKSIEVSCVWSDLGAVSLTLKYVFFENDGRIECSAKIKYLKDVYIDEEKCLLWIYPQERQMLNHSQIFVSDEGAFAYSSFFPPYAKFGKENDSVFFSGNIDAEKTIIESR